MKVQDEPMWEGGDNTILENQITLPIFHDQIRKEWQLCFNYTGKSMPNKTSICEVCSGIWFIVIHFIT